MREHRAHGTGVFAPAPAGTAKAKWEQRRRHGIAQFIHYWGIAAAYGALTAPEAQDALWLLGWFDYPPRRYEALCWYGGLHDRDAGAAKEVLERLAADPDTRALADFLRSTPDPLRNLPLDINDETLRPPEQRAGALDPSRGSCLAALPLQRAHGRRVLRFAPGLHPLLGEALAAHAEGIA